MIHDAYRFLIPILLLGILSAVLGWIFLAILFVVLALFIAFFYGGVGVISLVNTADIGGADFNHNDGVKGMGM